MAPIIELKFERLIVTTPEKSTNKEIKLFLWAYLKLLLMLVYFCLQISSIQDQACIVNYRRNVRCSPCLILSLNADKQQQHPVNFSSYHSSNLFCALQKHLLADLLHSFPINRPLIASCLCSVVFCYCVYVGISRIKWTTWCECVCGGVYVCA